MLEFIKIQKYLSEYLPDNNIPLAQKMFDKGEFMVSWFINDNCNFSCNYCGHYNRKPIPPKYDINHIAKSFDVFGDCGHIIITGGEPFLYPDFVKLCKLLTEKHYLSINTNLSQASVKDFAEQINPEKIIMINAGIHYDYRMDIGIGLEEYLDFYINLFEKGFNIVGSYVIHPTKITEDIENINKLKRMGVVNISAKTFSGKYNGYSYPGAYTKNELELVSSYMQHGLDMQEFLKYTSFENFYCEAGKNFFSIEHNGDALRCNTDRKFYGNIFNGTFKASANVEKCEEKFCVCPYQGMIYTQR
jgi:MoaA/NifB/PqqE/SkfB family radical SAM enzyme